MLTIRLLIERVFIIFTIRLLIERVTPNEMFLGPQYIAIKKVPLGDSFVDIFKLHCIKPCIPLKIITETLVAAAILT